MPNGIKSHLHPEGTDWHRQSVFHLVFTTVEHSRLALFKAIEYLHTYKIDIIIHHIELPELEAEVLGCLVSIFFFFSLVTTRLPS